MSAPEEKFLKNFENFAGEGLVPNVKNNRLSRFFIRSYFFAVQADIIRRWIIKLLVPPASGRAERQSYPAAIGGSLTT
ncbi:MAG: hypothetical protein LUF84_03655 [Clostridiales bacterium]|nr:hypothetical protein [Clostridiales bacterium]